MRGSHKASVTLFYLSQIAGCSAGSGNGVDEHGRPIGKASEPGDPPTFANIQTRFLTPACTQCHVGAATLRPAGAVCASKFALSSASCLAMSPAFAIHGSGVRSAQCYAMRFSNSPRRIGRTWWVRSYTFFLEKRAEVAVLPDTKVTFHTGDMGNTFSLCA